MLAAMDAAQAIGDLTEISPQILDVAIIGANGSIVGANAPESAAARLAAAAAKLVDEAERLRPGVAQLEAATVSGSVFVVRDGGRLIAAMTTPEPTVGLVFYDLKTCLRSVDEAPPKKRRAPAKKAEPEVDDAAS